MYKVTVQDITDGRETTVWMYEDLKTASKFIHDLHQNYKTFLKLEQGKDYEVELAQV